LHRVPDLAVTPGVQALLPSTIMSELPEPEVFAMMLVGLVLIGYRARRDSSEKFK
jgi:archaellum biogenesis protein FlaJ (TadC family)